MDLKLHVWRQPGPDAPGKMVAYEARDISSHASFLEMLDILNESLVEKGEDPIAFESDCREGICGTCSLVIDGLHQLRAVPHTPPRAAPSATPGKCSLAKPVDSSISVQSVTL